MFHLFQIAKKMELLSFLPPSEKNEDSNKGINSTNSSSRFKKYFNLLLLTIILGTTIFHFFTAFGRKVDEKYINQFIGKILNKTFVP